jgi:hypothetical protein
MRVRPRRRGYAMVAVVAFVLIFLGLWTVAARQIDTMLRIEQARSNRIKREGPQGNLPALRALAQAIEAFNWGYPPPNDPSHPSPACPCYRTVTVDGTEFAIEFAVNPDDPTDWTVTVSTMVDPGMPPLDPSQFEASPSM